ncbi:S-layer homology domain-containing protein [Paenibacillus sp. OV219]|uniref:S-layer homology domain-containing protein n=1 Tax=Paenibacillus sp. OV219 TaxID=1884377 RepID=UPI000B88E5A9
MPSAGESVSFTDQTAISTWAAKDVDAAVSLELIKGRSADKFEPKGMTTRAEAAQVIYSLLKL